MKRQVFVFDEYVSSQKNGIGSFLKEFCNCMKQLEAVVCMLVFNADVKELTIENGKNAVPVFSRRSVYASYRNCGSVASLVYR